MVNKDMLIVDDSATMRNMIKAVVQEMGYIAHTAQDGEKAFRMCQSQNFTLIITDINMPNMDGIELIRVIRESNNATPILVITTEGGDNVKQAGKAAGASGWIVKPFNPETLKRAIGKLCGA